MSRTFIYVVTCGRYSKIGIARNPTSRLKELQGGNPERLTIHCLFMATARFTAQAVERFALRHAKNLGIRKSGEWIDATPEVAKEIVLLGIRARNAELAADEAAGHITFRQVSEEPVPCPRADMLPLMKNVRERQRRLERERLAAYRA